MFVPEYPIAGDANGKKNGRKTVEHLDLKYEYEY